MSKVVLVTATAGLEIARMIVSNPNHFADFISVIEKVEIPEDNKPFAYVEQFLKELKESENA